MTPRTTEVEEKIKAAIDANADEQGWADLAKVGPMLKMSGIDYGIKLGLYFDDFLDVTESKYSANNPPIRYIRWKNRNNISVSLSRPTVTVRNVPTQRKHFSNYKTALNDWGTLAKYDSYKPNPSPETLISESKKSIRYLKDKVLKGEKWYYGNKVRTDHPILKAYLNYTFYRLQKEDEVNEGKNIPKKIAVAGKYAAFNTGLVDNRYRPIYALFIKNDLIQKYQLMDFCTSAEGQNTGKELVRNFKPLPERAHYFDKPADMLYDISCGKPETSLQHIIRDNADRLPIQLLKDNLPKDFIWQDIEGMTFEERIPFFKSLGSAIFENDRLCRKVESEIDRAIDLAMKRIAWNFKTGIPMYFPTQNIMSLLLPLSIMEDETVDAALVVEKTESGNYLGHTILTLKMAYSNARLVSRPDSDWLAVEKIDRDSQTDDSLSAE